MSNQEIVILNEDQKAVALKTTKDLFFAAKELHDRIGRDGLTNEMAGVLPSLIEGYFVELASQLDYGSKLAKDVEERHQTIREKNIRIRDLEKQLAENKPIDGLSEQLYQLYQHVSDWWNTHGFHHVSEPGFTSSGIFTGKFAFMLDHLGRMSRKPVTEKRNYKERIQDLINEGWEIIFDQNGRSPQLVDNENNRARLINLIKGRFPSAKIIKTRNWPSEDNENVFIYRNVEVYIYDLRDIPGEKEEV